LRHSMSNQPDNDCNCSYQPVHCKSPWSFVSSAANHNRHCDGLPCRPPGLQLTFVSCFFQPSFDFSITRAPCRISKWSVGYMKGALSYAARHSRRLDARTITLSSEPYTLTTLNVRSSVSIRPTEQIRNTESRARWCQRSTRRCQIGAKAEPDNLLSH